MMDRREVADGAVATVSEWTVYIGRATSARRNPDTTRDGGTRRRASINGVPSGLGVGIIPF